jgi:hypothetical protein
VARRLVRRLAAWTAASATAALAAAWLLPVALTPSTRLDEDLTRLCAALVVLVTAGGWAATGVAVVATTRTSRT